MSNPPPRVRYICQRCTACCRWPGDVCLDDDEVGAAARHLGLDEHEFIQRFTRLRTNRSGLSLIEKENHECIFLQGQDCLIQEVKPRQCRRFPNEWNFPGWRDFCQALPVPVEDEEPSVEAGGI